MHRWVTAKELADKGLVGLPATVQGINKKAGKENWPSQPRSGRGGGKEYPISTLPEAARMALIERHLSGNNKPSLPVPADINIDITQLTATQRAVADARVVILNEIAVLAEDFGTTLAIKTLVSLSKTGGLRSELQAVVETANARSGKKYGTGKQTLCRATLFNWRKAHNAGGYGALAPKATKEASLDIPTWAPALMGLYRRPQKPSLAAVMEDLPTALPVNTAMPSYDQARRFLHKLSAVTLQRGRMGPQALKSLKAFTRRDTSELWPGAVYTSDGHTFKATVQHPIHGQPFRPEVTIVLDVFTRYAVGWSLGLAENSIGVLEALSHAVAERGDNRKRALPAIWYTDNGPGFRAKIFEDTCTGFYDRWGVTPKNSLPYNSQARGLVERFQQFWVVTAKSLPSYNARHMDSEATRIRKKITDKELKAGRPAPFHMTFEDFKTFMQERVDHYNARPHSSLDRLRDPDTLKRRYMSPTEKWQAWEDASNQPILIHSDDAADLFRPYERRKVARCEVQVLGNRYFSHDLDPHHGEEVMVGYDIHDASKVWIRDFDNRLICTAELDGNAKPYFPAETVAEARSYLQLKADQRVKGRLKRLDEKRDEVLAEVRPDFLEVEYQELTLRELEGADRERVRMEALAEPAPKKISNGGRPIFSSHLDLAAWLMENPDRATDQDRKLLSERIRLRTFRDLLEINGIEIGALQAAITSEATEVITYLAASQ